MREIKFRAWDGNRKRMVTPDVLAHNKNIGTWVTAYYDDKDGYLRNPGAMDNIILMQYTGLKDKNGVEIYEGDILRLEDYVNHEVYYNKGSFKVADGHIIGNTWSEKMIEVIGNIYENPELLK